MWELEVDDPWHRSVGPKGATSQSGVLAEPPSVKRLAGQHQRVVVPCSDRDRRSRQRHLHGRNHGIRTRLLSSSSSSSRRHQAGVQLGISDRAEEDQRALLRDGERVRGASGDCAEAVAGERGAEGLQGGVCRARERLPALGVGVAAEAPQLAVRGEQVAVAPARSHVSARAAELAVVDAAERVILSGDDRGHQRIRRKSDTRK